MSQGSRSDDSIVYTIYNTGEDDTFYWMQKIENGDIWTHENDLKIKVMYV